MNNNEVGFAALCPLPGLAKQPDAAKSWEIDKSAIPIVSSRPAS